MPDARLEVTDALGRRIVPIGKEAFGIGRRETNDLRLAGSEVSRDHAEIVTEGKKVLIRDRNSRYGTYVNGDQVTTRYDDARQVMAALEDAGIDYDDVIATLEQEGVDKFVKSWDELVETVRGQMDAAK